MQGRYNIALNKPVKLEPDSYANIMELPALTSNNEMFGLLKNTVTPKDIAHGTNPNSFAYAHLIEWAVRNKKYENYYAYIKQFKTDSGDNGRLQAQINLRINKTVIVRFNVAGEPLFGFYWENDLEPALMYPGKDGLMSVSL